MTSPVCPRWKRGGPPPPLPADLTAWAVLTSAANPWLPTDLQSRPSASYPAIPGGGWQFGGLVAQIAPEPEIWAVPTPPSPGQLSIHSQHVQWLTRRRVHDLAKRWYRGPSLQPCDA